MRTKDFIFCVAALLVSNDVLGWGAEGHRVIGVAAYGMLDERAARMVREILGEPAPEALNEALSKACNWPDAVRNDALWNWSSPLHYVNIPRNTGHYDRERDCPDGRCVTEGILHFANQLSYRETDMEKQWQAFAFVCHLVADLHQPLHAGFRDDRGGNTVEVEYRGDEWNLHQFWDSVNVRAHLIDEQRMVAQLVHAGLPLAGSGWSPVEVGQWTEASHALAAERAYPEGPLIGEAFASEAWELTREQWQHAATRLARILNAVLGESAVQPSD